MSKAALSLLALAALSASAAILSTEPISNSIAARFLKEIQKFEQFQSVFILKDSNQNDDELIKDISIALEVPVILSSEKGSIYLKGKFNSELLVIVFVDPIAGDDILYELWGDLDHMRFSKTFFLLNFPSKDVEVLTGLFESCWSNRMINVLAVFRDFPTTLTYYSYSHMPKFVIEENLLENGPPTEGYFPDRMRDVKGHEMSVVFGGSEPKTIIWKNKRGETSIGGYAANLLLAVAKKHNANISSALFRPDSSAIDLFSYYVNPEKVEISSATTSSPSLPMITYPYEYIDMCVMMPVERKIPIYQIFMIVFQWQALLLTIVAIIMLSTLLESAVYLSGRKTIFLNYIINDSCLRGALAQSFIEIPNASIKIRLVYLVICLIGIILVTSYGAFLQTYLYSPPSEKRIETLDDLRKLGFKIYSLESEFYVLMFKAPEIKANYFDMFLSEPDFAKFVKFRDSFNTSYAYIVNNVKWVIVQEQQRLLKNPLFRLDREMCPAKRFLMGFPINENSIFRNLLNFAILEAYSSGLLDFWQRKAFRELIEAKKLQFLRIVEKPEFVPLKVDDLKLIWMGMIVASGLAILCFLCEIFIFKWKTWKGHLKK